MTTEKIVDAIRNESDGTFVGSNCTSTLIGWKEEFDEKGRPVTCDPNYKDSKFNICGKTYYVTRYEWNVIIWKDKGSYIDLFRSVKPADKLIEIDLTPDYVKKYRDREFNKLLSRCEVKILTLYDMIDMNLYYSGELEDIFDKNSTYKVWILTDEEENRIPKKLNRIIKYEEYK